MYLHYLLSRRRHFTIWTVFKKGKKFSLKKVKIQTPISNPSGALKGSFSKVQNVRGYIGNNDAPFWLVSWPKLKVYIYIYMNDLFIIQSKNRFTSSDTTFHGVAPIISEILYILEVHLLLLYINTW